MAVSLDPVVDSLQSHPKRKRWNRSELQLLIAAGLTDLERYELFDGELIDKMGKNRPHVFMLLRVMDWLRSVYGSDYLTHEAPINLRAEDNPTHRPEPDAAVLRVPYANFQRVDPGPEDIRLLIEISDTTTAFDLGPKAKKYAEAGIPEYWVVDVNNLTCTVHRDPAPEGYRSISSYPPEQPLTPLSAPGSSTTIAALLA